MKQHLFIILLGVFSLILGGCEAVVDFPGSNEIKQVPVIEALLTDQTEPQKVRFCYSTTLNNSASVNPVENANIYVYSNKGDTMQYSYKGEGYYQSEPYCAFPDIIYTLVVQTDTASFKATGSLIPMHGLDSIKIQYSPTHANDDSAYYLHLGIGPVVKGIQKYYQLKIFRNNDEITKPSAFSLITDKFDKSLDDIKVQYALKLNDTVTLELYSLSQKVYSIYDQFNQLLFLSYSSIGYMENPISMFDGYAMGFFQISAVDRKTIIIK